MEMLRFAVFCLTAIGFVGAQNICPDWKCNTTRCDKKPIDVIFLIDGSESINPHDFNESLRWVLTNVKRLDPNDRKEGLQVSLVQYSTNPTLHLQETLTTIPSSDFENFERGVLSIQQKSSGTDTYGALNYVNTNVYPTTRTGTFKILITLTDGKPQEPVGIVRDDVINSARNNFNVMVAVGVGSNIGEDELRQFTHRAEPINVVDFVRLQDDITFDGILNSTRKDCIEIRVDCGPRTKHTVNVSYCVCDPQGTENDLLSMIESYQLQISGDNGIMRTVTKPVEESTMEFVNLDPYTTYSINVNATLRESNTTVTVISDTTNCSTKGCIQIKPKCENVSETSLKISYGLQLNGIQNVNKYIKELKIEIYPEGKEVNSWIKKPNDTTASFSGLSSGITYTITITPIFVDDTAANEIVVEPASINCTTKDCPKECVPKPLNAVFLVDGSESISAEIFNNSLYWISDTISKFRNLDKDEKERRVMTTTVVQYSDTATIAIRNRMVHISPSNNDGIFTEIYSIKQKKQGTKPYTSLRHVNDNDLLNDTFYNVLITLGDGQSRNEVRDISVINTARNNYNKMLSVGVSDDVDMNSEVIKHFTHESEPFRMDDAGSLCNITEVINRESYEDCIKFIATCKCDPAGLMILLKYDVSLWGSLKNENELISSYTAKIKSLGYERPNIPLYTRSALFDQSTDSSLNLLPHTTYELEIDGKKSRECGAVVPATVNCSTRAEIRPTLTCADVTLTSVAVNINLDSTGFGSDFSVIQDLILDISPSDGGLGRQSINARPGEMESLPFTRLSPSTDYTITVYPNKAADVCGVNESDSVVCPTKDDICVAQPIDLVFLVDGSESIDQNIFKEGLNWMSETADRFNQKERNEPLRVVAVQYSNIVQQEFTRILQPSVGISADVGGITQIRSSTETFTGLRFITYSVTPSARNDSCKILVTMSDGDSTENPDQSAIDSVKNDYDVMIAVGYKEPIVYEAQLLELSTVGKPISIQDSASMSTIVNKAIETCCRKELKLRVSIVVFCDATTNSADVSYYPIPAKIGKDSSLIRNYQVTISEGGVEKSSLEKSVNETMASFFGLKAFTTYTIKVTGQPIDETTVEVITASVNCMTKDPCATSPCQNGGTCALDGDSGYKCNCQSGWTGMNCETVDAVIKPTVHCVFTTDNAIVVEYKVAPTQRGYDSTLISSYSIGISPSGAGTNFITNAVGDMTALFTELTPSTAYVITVSVNKASGATVNSEVGSVTCETTAIIQPTVTDQPQTSDANTTTISTSTLAIATSTPVSVRNPSATTDEVTSIALDSTTAGSMTAASSVQSQDQCRTPIIILAVLLAIAVIVAIAFAIAFARKRSGRYDVGEAMTN